MRLMNPNQLRMNQKIIPFRKNNIFGKRYGDSGDQQYNLKYLLKKHFLKDTECHGL
jgi:hypothetical protein